MTTCIADRCPTRQHSVTMAARPEICKADRSYRYAEYRPWATNGARRAAGHLTALPNRVLTVARTMLPQQVRTLGRCDDRYPCAHATSLPVAS
jgi:hypothetical protein